MGEKKGLCCVKMKKKGKVFIGRGGVVVRPFWVGKGGKLNLNLMRVGGIYGEEEVDVNGAWGNWEEELR